MSGMDLKNIADDPVKIYVPGRYSAKVIKEPQESEKVKIYSGKSREEDVSTSSAVRQP